MASSVDVEIENIIADTQCESGIEAQTRCDKNFSSMFLMLILALEVESKANSANGDESNTNANSKNSSPNNFEQIDQNNFVLDAKQKKKLDKFIGMGWCFISLSLCAVTASCQTVTKKLKETESRI
jgi:hypothetical protein